MSPRLLNWLLAAILVQLAVAQEPTPAKIAATETDVLMAKEGEEVIVTGFIESARRSASGIHFLNFKDAEFECVTFAQYAGAFTEGTPSELYDQKSIEVRGTITIYRGKPQIKLESPDQVTIPAPSEAPKVAEAENPEPEMEEKAEPEATSEPAEEPKVAVVQSAPAGSLAVETETIEGILPVDWRLFFPQTPPKAADTAK